MIPSISNYWNRLTVDKIIQRIKRNVLATYCTLAEDHIENKIYRGGHKRLHRSVRCSQRISEAIWARFPGTDGCLHADVHCYQHDRGSREVRSEMLVRSAAVYMAAVRASRRREKSIASFHVLLIELTSLSPPPLPLVAVDDRTHWAGVGKTDIRCINSPHLIRTLVCSRYCCDTKQRSMQVSKRTAQKYKSVIAFCHI